MRESAPARGCAAGRTGRSPRCRRPPAPGPAASSRRAISTASAAPTPQCPYRTIGPSTCARISATQRRRQLVEGQARPRRARRRARGSPPTNSAYPAGSASASGWYTTALPPPYGHADAATASRCRPAPAGSARAAAGAGRARPPATSSERGELADGRVLEQVEHRPTPGRARRAQPGDHLGGEQRVAAEVEEVVVDADPRRRRSTSAQIAATVASDSVPRRGVPRRRRRGRAAGAGSAAPVELAVGRQRQRVQGDEGRRAPCSRAAVRLSAARSAAGSRRRPTT